MKPIEFTIDAGPGTTWKVRVVIHPNKKSLHRARRAFGKNFSPGVSAFCKQFGYVEAESKNLIAEIHLDRSNLLLSDVVHEAAHASVNFLKQCRLDLNTKTGDETFAESIEHLVCGIRWGIRKYCHCRI